MLSIQLYLWEFIWFELEVHAEIRKHDVNQLMQIYNSSFY